MKEKKRCINCGAQLTGTKCDYCGTEYDTDSNGNVGIKGKMINDYIVELEIDGENVRFYVGDIKTNKEIIDVSTLEDKKNITQTKRKITLIEF